MSLGQEWRVLECVRHQPMSHNTYRNIRLTMWERFRVRLDESSLKKMVVQGKLQSNMMWGRERYSIPPEPFIGELEFHV